MELAEQPLKLTDMQTTILQARLQLLQQDKLNYSPCFVNEEEIRKSIGRLATFDGNIAVIESLLEDAEMQKLKDSEEE